jgi:6-pyruvoyl-tetrahydropterin synthase
MSLPGSSAAPSRTVTVLTPSATASITIGGDGTFAFSAAHAGLHGGEFEPLHGHSFTVMLCLRGTPDETGMICDFTGVKKALAAAIAPLKRRTLMPASSPACRDYREATQVVIECGSKRYSLPAEDVVLLPVANTTTEAIAGWLLAQVLPALSVPGLRRAELTLAEASDTCATAAVDLGGVP